MLRLLIDSLSDRAGKILPSLQHSRAVSILRNPLTTGRLAVAIAFGSNLVGNCDLPALAICLAHLGLCAEGEQCLEYTSCNQTASTTWH